LSVLFSTEALSFKDKIHYPDLDIPSSTPVFLVGKNGSGKSTLFKMFNRTIAPSSGRIFYQGQDITDISPLDLRREVLLVSQAVFLFDKTIHENFVHFHTLFGNPVPTESTIESFLKITNANFGLNSATRTLSGGERQRVYLALFLSFKPKVLLLDEPTAALDKEASVDVMAQILSYCEDTDISCITISHDANIVSLFSKQIVRLS